MRIFFCTFFTLLVGICMAQIKPVSPVNTTSKTVQNSSTLRTTGQTTIYDTTYLQKSNDDTTISITTYSHTAILDTTIGNTIYSDTTITETFKIDSITPDSTINDTIVRNTIIRAQTRDTSYNTASNTFPDTIGVNASGDTIFVDTAGTAKYTMLKIIVSGDTLSEYKANKDKNYNYLATPLDTLINVTYLDSTIRDTITVKPIATDTVASAYILTVDTIAVAQILDTAIGSIVYMDTLIHQTVVTDTISSTFPYPDSTFFDTTIVNAYLIPINLPFFDDFSTTLTSYPHPLRWAPGGGTLVNNNYPLLPPSQNAVTFDGLNAKGQPYGVTYGWVDSLTSWTIDISKLSPADSVYLSFYWQEGGYADGPTYDYGSNELDSIALFFKDTSQIWQPVWSQRGNNNVNTTPFKQTLIALDTAFFHSTFQFRFVASGPEFGGVSIWNLDYFLMDSGRNYIDTTHRDLAFMSPPGHLLKNYTAMPADQFFGYEAKELAESITFTIKNLGDAASHQVIEVVDTTEIYNNDTLTVDTTETFSTSYAQASISADAIIDNDTIYNRQDPLPGSLPIASQDTGYATINISLADTATFDFPNDSAQIITTKIRLHTPDLVVAGINYNLNDTITVSTSIQDYFAYDDGTAEWGIQYVTTDNQLAIEYSLNKPDSITAVEFYFPHYTYAYDSVAGTDLYLKVWDSISVAGNFAHAVHTETIPLQYSPLNQFVRYNLDSAVALGAGPFYVGLGVETNPNLQVTFLIGYDANTYFPNKSFCNYDNVWSPCQLNVDVPPGSFMVRPVFANSVNAPLGIQKPINTLECTVYPNPGNGLINITGKVSNAKVYDVTGLLLAQQNFNVLENVKSMNLESLNSGMYLINLSNSTATTVKKIIITK